MVYKDERKEGSMDAVGSENTAHFSVHTALNSDSVWLSDSVILVKEEAFQPYELVLSSHAYLLQSLYLSRPHSSTVFTCSTNKQPNNFIIHWHETGQSITSHAAWSDGVDGGPNSPLRDK